MFVFFINNLTDDVDFFFFPPVQYYWIFKMEGRMDES